MCGQQAATWSLLEVVQGASWRIQLELRANALLVQ